MMHTELDKAVKKTKAEIAKIDAQIGFIKDKAEKLQRLACDLLGDNGDNIPHTDTAMWAQVPEPISLKTRLPWKPTMPTWCWCWNSEQKNKLLRLITYMQEYTTIPNQYVTYNADGTRREFIYAVPCKRINIPSWFPAAWIGDDNK